MPTNSPAFKGSSYVLTKCIKHNDNFSFVIRRLFAVVPETLGTKYGPSVLAICGVKITRTFSL